MGTCATAGRVRRGDVRSMRLAIDTSEMSGRKMAIFNEESALVVFPLESKEVWNWKWTSENFLGEWNGLLYDAPSCV